MAKGKALTDVDESDFVHIPAGRRDIRKTMQAIRKKQLRAAELRMRRAHNLRKKLGMKND